MANYLENAYQEIEKAKREKKDKNPMREAGITVSQMMKAIQGFSEAICVPPVNPKGFKRGGVSRNDTIYKAAVAAFGLKESKTMNKKPTPPQEPMMAQEAYDIIERLLVGKAGSIYSDSAMKSDTIMEVLIKLYNYEG